MLNGDHISTWVKVVKLKKNGGHFNPGNTVVYASSLNKFWSVSSPVEDTVDFLCEEPKSSAVEEKKEINRKPPSFVNSYWFNALCNKLQCYSEMSGNQTVDQYRMEDDSLNSKADSSFY